MENYYPKPEKDTISIFILNTIFGSFMKTKSVNNGNFAAEGGQKKRNCAHYARAVLRVKQQICPKSPANPYAAIIT